MTVLLTAFVLSYVWLSWWISGMEYIVDCTCHVERIEKTHELCCGHGSDGTDANCPVHGDGSNVDCISFAHLGGATLYAGIDY